MLRKIGVIVGLLLLPLVVQAQESVIAGQPPIIALNKNMLHAVSPVDGSAQVIVQPAEGEVLVPQLSANSISPDGRWLVYAIFKQGETPNLNATRLFMLDLHDYSSAELLPVGGVFDRPIPVGHRFFPYLPTWSYDGSRVYFLRTENDANGTNVSRELVYYTPTGGSYHLVGRIDPNTQIEGLTAVPSGMVLRTHVADEEMTTFTLYALDNTFTRQLHEQSLAPDVVVYEGRFYLTVQKFDRQIETLIDVETNDTLAMTSEVYPAVRSRTAGDSSIGIYQPDNSRSFSFYSEKPLATFESPRVTRYAVAPDGQAIAFAPYDRGNWVGPIHIIDMSGQIRELPFEAHQLVWGAHETEVVDPAEMG